MVDRHLHIGREDFLELSEEIVGKGKQFGFTAMGKSMSPFIIEGDTVIVSPISEPIEVGDIVLVRSPEGAPILHRIIKLLPNGVVTRGDAVRENDGFIPAENVVGVVERVSGNGSNFHLLFPFKYIITKRNLFDFLFKLFPFLKRMLKKILRVPQRT